MPGELYDTDRVLTLPNALSAARLVGVPIFVWLLLGPKQDLVAVGVLAVGGVTDWLDGFLARRWHQTSRVGQILDPIADRLYILAILACLAIRDVIPWWLVGLLVLRDLVLLTMVPFLKVRGYTSLPVHFIGKAGTFCLLYAFPLIVLGGVTSTFGMIARVAGWAFAFWGTWLYWCAGILYVRQTVTLLREMKSSVRVLELRAQDPQSSGSYDRTRGHSPQSDVQQISRAAECKDIVQP